MTFDQIPRLPIGFLPTPVGKLERLGARLGIDLWVKQDDFTGFGGGGNKIRKLEFLMADAVAAGANVLITTGGHQSNHARMVAAAARKYGMRAVLVLRGNKPNELTGNLLLDHVFGAEIEFLDPDAYFTQIAPRMEAHAEAARANGETPYIIPLGGASALGAMGYVGAMLEMAGQYEEAGRQVPDYVVAAVGSGGMLAGMVIGGAMVWPDSQIVGIAVSGSAVPFPQRIAVMANAGAELIDVPTRWADTDIRVETDYIGPGYGQPSEAGNAAIKLAARDDGLLLDPVYTGKGMSGLIDLVEKGAIPQGSSVLFIHSGGAPALYPFGKSLTEDY